MEQFCDHTRCTGHRSPRSPLLQTDMKLVTAKALQLNRTEMKQKWTAVVHAFRGHTYANGEVAQPARMRKAPNDREHHKPKCKDGMPGGGPFWSQPQCSYKFCGVSLWTLRMRNAPMRGSRDHSGRRHYDAVESRMLGQDSMSIKEQEGERPIGMANKQDYDGRMDGYSPSSPSTTSSCARSMTTKLNR